MEPRTLCLLGQVAYHWAVSPAFVIFFYITFIYYVWACMWQSEDSLWESFFSTMWILGIRRELLSHLGECNVYVHACVYIVHVCMHIYMFIYMHMHACTCVRPHRDTYQHDPANFNLLFSYLHAPLCWLGSWHHFHLDIHLFPSFLNTFLSEWQSVPWTFCVSCPDGSQLFLHGT